MKTLKTLSKRDYKSLLEFPAYISLLAANSDGKMDKAEKLSAVEFAHTKTYSCNPLLAEFYKEVDKTFASTIENINNALPLKKTDRDVAIKSKLSGLEQILLKLSPDYATIVHQSMESFKAHVSAAHHNILIDFIFPVPIKGLSY